jgi:hypothetical protein
VFADCWKKMNFHEINSGVKPFVHAAIHVITRQFRNHHPFMGVWWFL